MMVVLDEKPFLRPESVKAEGETFEIMDEGEIITKEASPFGREIFQITVQNRDGTEFVWTANKTSIRALITAYGKDTKNWIGQPVELFVREQNVRGVQKKVIYARIPQVGKE